MQLFSSTYDIESNWFFREKAARVLAEPWVLVNVMKKIVTPILYVLYREVDI